jgi:amino acid adenylation domain-containing protein
VPVANRDRFETEWLIGFFVNTLVLRADLSRAASFGDLLRQVREASLGAFAHQDAPFERLVDELQPQRDLSRSPLFQVALVLQSAPLSAADLDGVRLVHEEVPGEIAKFDLAFAFDVSGLGEAGGGRSDRIGGALEYATDLYTETTAARMARGFGVLLASLLADSRAPLAAASLLAEAERHQLLHEWNDTAAEYARERTASDLLAATAARRPDAVAAVCEGASLTYGALAASAGGLARRLASAGAGRGTPVAIWMERSLDAVVAVAGTLAIGACYVPIDSSWPAERAAAVLAGIGAPIVLTRSAQRSSVLARVGRLSPPPEIVCVDLAAPAPERGAPPPAAASAGDLAYVIHTSGSTGTPKGIGVQHRPLVNHFAWVNGTFEVGPGDRLLAVNSLGFDLSVYDFLGTLAAGGTLLVAPEAALRDPASLARRLVEEQVTIWHSAPSALLQLAPFFPPPAGEGEDVPPLRLAMLAGDWIPLTLPAEIRAAFPRARVLNLGGATETSVWSNAYEIEAVDPRWPSVPYGRPIANARYHVVDAHLAPCPIGVTGDMLIGGEILSLGYIGRPEATAERFLPDPFAEQPGSRLWLTGDRGRYGADGNLEFLGRVDHQVKVRGYRIELGEIEVALSRHPGIREAVVLAREDVPGEQRLVAYVVPAAAAAEPAEGDGAGRVDALRAFLLASLPEPMVPWDFIAMERLPVTANGKLDRAALPAPRDARGAAAPAYVAPRNELERAIGAAWREVLGVERIGVRESFFQAGGSSLLMARLQSRLRQTLARDIPFVELFKHPTIESLARSLGEPANLAAEAAGPAPGPQSRPAERARLRRESMRQVQQGGRRPRGGRGQRHE